jgi:hypothetical protein
MSMLDNILQTLENLHIKIDKIEQKMNIIPEKNDIKNLKKTKIELDDDFIKVCLEKSSLLADFEIIKKIYFDISYNKYPIQSVNKKLYKYWLNDKWNLDSDGKYIKDVFIGNLHSCYLRFNKYEKYINNTDLYIKNQEYISFIDNDEKYKTRLLNHVKEYIESNSENKK